jgi:haloacetate dehalogenase
LAWNNPETIRAMCDDYRAAIDFDFAIDQVDLTKRVVAPTFVMWGADGAMAKSYDMAAVWKDKLIDMHTCAMPGGHFFPDMSSARTAEELLTFLRCT